jgi:hypothetical protein
MKNRDSRGLVGSTAIARPPTPSQLHMPGLAALRGTTRGSPRLRAAGGAWLPSALPGSHPAQAAPRGSSPSPALSTVRALHARAPVRTPVAPHVPLVPRAVLHGTPLVDPNACPPLGAPDLSTPPVGAGARPRPGVPACPRVRCPPRASVQGGAAGVLASLLEHGVRTYGRPGCVPTGDAPRTYGRPGCVPTGDAPRTYGRRFSMQSYTKQSVMHPRL